MGTLHRPARGGAMLTGGGPGGVDVMRLVGAAWLAPAKRIEPRLASLAGPDEGEPLLTGWTAGSRAAAGRRDDVVRAAVGTAPDKADVHRLTGIAGRRSTRSSAPPGSGKRLAITGSARPCVSIACPYAEPVYGISGRARRNASLSGPPGLRFHAIAVMTGQVRQAWHGTANAVGCNHPPGFKSPILRSSQALSRNRQGQGRRCGCARPHPDRHSCARQATRRTREQPLGAT
jgi:hypothetical protein